MEFDEIQRRSRELFRIEAADLVAELEAALLDLEQRPEERALIDRVFRAMHTLKGSGATAGFADLSAFLHHVEEVYNAAREGRMTVTSQLVDLTLRIVDSVDRYLKAPPAETAAILHAASACLAELQALRPAAAANSPSNASSDAHAPSPALRTVAWRIRFAPHATVFQHGIDPGMFLDDLRGLGSAKIRTLTDRLPPFAEMDPESCYLAWEIELATAATCDAIKDVFAFVSDDCDLDFAPKHTAESEPRHRWWLQFQITPETAASPGALRGLWQELEQLGSLRTIVSPEGAGLSPPAPGRSSSKRVPTPMSCATHLFSSWPRSFAWNPSSPPQRPHRLRSTPLRWADPPPACRLLPPYVPGRPQALRRPRRLPATGRRSSRQTSCGFRRTSWTGSSIWSASW